MTREDAIKLLWEYRDCLFGILREPIEMAIKALEQEKNIKALGEDMRIMQKAIKNKKVLIGFNLAVAICNKHLGEGEEV